MADEHSESGSEVMHDGFAAVKHRPKVAVWRPDPDAAGVQFQEQIEITHEVVDGQALDRLLATPVPEDAAYEPVLVRVEDIVSQSWTSCPAP